MAPTSEGLERGGSPKQHELLHMGALESWRGGDSLDQKATAPVPGPGPHGRQAVSPIPGTRDPPPAQEWDS